MQETHLRVNKGKYLRIFFKRPDFSRPCKTKGVLIEIAAHLKFEAEAIEVDKEGRLIILQAHLGSDRIMLVNIYVPNDKQYQQLFFTRI